jgi:hypothetical protein
MKKWLIKGTVTNIIAYAITISISALILMRLSDLKISEHWKSLIVGFLIGGALFASWVIQKFLWWLRRGLAYKFTEKNLGIIEVFPNLTSCEHLIKKDFGEAKKIKLFLQIGRRQLGSHPGMFEKLAERKTMEDDDIRVLHASSDSYYVEKGAEKKGTEKKDVYLRVLKEGIRATETQIKFLQEKMVRIESKTHQEPFVWKFFILDDKAYILGYTPKNVDETSIVYKIKDAEHSLYRFFNKYFDDLWDKTTTKK